MTKTAPGRLETGIALDSSPQAPVSASALTSTQQRERHLRGLLEQGLPLTPRPWQSLAKQCGMSEAAVMAAVEGWQQSGLIKRLGLVVKHRALGITANAMVVWDVPDAQVRELGQRLAKEPAVTLCYQRPRRLPQWPFNLFCMIHGTARERVLAELDALIRRQGLQGTPHQVLFSTRAYRQRGARYVGDDPETNRRLADHQAGGQQTDSQEEHDDARRRRQA